MSETRRLHPGFGDALLDCPSITLEDKLIWLKAALDLCQEVIADLSAEVDMLRAGVSRSQLTGIRRISPGRAQAIRAWRRKMESHEQNDVS